MSIEHIIDEEAIFSAALAIDAADQRQAYVETACQGDTALLSRIEALLKIHASEQSFLEQAASSLQLTLDTPAIVEGPGTTIDRYRLLEKIGEGGMAVVYMAEQTEPIHRKVALKIIKLGMDTRQVIARFEAERQALALMDHPGIAKVLDAGATDTGRPYFVMELVQGISITEYCDRNSLSIRDRLALFMQVCNAVQHAHQKGIIHRDIKPSNVMVTLHDGKPVPKVIDFGIAKATNQNLTEKTLFTRYAQLLGTPAYMSPEQTELSDLDIDTRSDVYSLGVLLYELLTGTTPFGEEELRRAGFIEMQRVIREQEPVKPSTKLGTLGETLTEVAKCHSSTPDLLRKAVRGDLDWIVMKSLAKERTRRYNSASTLLADIERYLGCKPVLAGPPTAAYQARKLLQRHWPLITVATTVSVVVVAGLIASTILYLRAEEARRNEAAARAQAQAVTDFLTQDLLASVFPERARNREVTVRYLLENASRSLEGRFADSPLAEVQIREVLGSTYQKMGDYAPAIPHIERVLQIRREQLGADHPSTLASLGQLGILYSNQGRHREATTLLAAAFDAKKRVLGKEHSDTLKSMSDLAWQYMSEARFAEGASLAAQVTEVGRRVLGDEHPVVLKAMGSLASAYIAAMRYAEAEPLIHKGYENSRRILGAEHETTLFLLNQLNWLHEQQGRGREILEEAVEALESSRRVLGDEHIITIWAMSNLGGLYLRQGQLEEAAPLVSRAAELAARIVGEDHPGTILFKFKLAGLYDLQGRHEEQDALLIRLIEASRRVHGEDHPQTGYIIYSLWQRVIEFGTQGQQHYEAGDFAGAAEAFRRSGEVRRALFGNPTPGEVARRVICLHTLGRADEAKTELTSLRMMYEHGDHAYEAEPLHETEHVLAPETGGVRRIWELIAADELDDALALFYDLQDDDTLDPADRQNAAKALARAYCRRAAMAEIECDYGEAQRNCEAAVGVCPDYALPLQRLAWLRATCPADEMRGAAEAIDLATRACGLTQWANVECLETLAAGYAETGDFVAAATWQEKAIDSLPTQAHRGRRAVSEHRLHLYRTRCPCRTGISRSPIAIWNFDQVVGQTVIDASGNGHNGTLMGGATIAFDEERGSVLTLEGPGYVDCGANPAFDITGPITVTAWIRTHGLSRHYQVIVTKSYAAWNLLNSRQINTIHFAARGIRVSRDEMTTLTGTQEVTDDRWHHIAAVYDGLRMSLYVDGVLDKWAGASGALDLSDDPVRIGGVPESPGSHWTGSIDDVRIYGCALNEMEIGALQSGGEPNAAPNQRKPPGGEEESAQRNHGV